MTELRERVRRLPKAPVEGWISLVGILVLTLTLAWSIDDAAGCSAATTSRTSWP